MQTKAIPFILTILTIFGCETSNQTSKENKPTKIDQTKNNLFTRVATWNEDSSYFELSYKGPEFTGKYIKDSLWPKDAAHRTSTEFTHVIGPFLKSSFRRKNYRKLDLANLKVNFKGSPNFRFNSNKQIEYKISVPILRVKKRNEAMTSVEHKGTWIKDYEKCSDKNFSEWKNRIAKGSESEVESKRIEQDAFLELWLQWRTKGM